MSYKEAAQLLHECSSKYGFYASTEKSDNYKRVWSRDGVITGLAALLTEDEKLIDTFKRTLDTLLDYQGRQGEIASNIEPEKGEVSYGITSGRVDATIWYVIGCVRYYKKTKDSEFLLKHYPGMRMAISLLECWEFNRRDFIYVPESGDWADEIPRRGYLLYDQALYYSAIDEFIDVKTEMSENYQYLEEKRKRLREKIRTNFWPQDPKQEYVYHKPTFDRLRKDKPFFLESFSVNSYRFDAFGNILCMMLDISSKEQSKKIVEYISEISSNRMVPSFYPVISQENAEWKDLSERYSFSFKNKPHMLHNGGLWPMINGFYVSALCKIGEKNLASHYLNLLTEANKAENWGFYEYLHGKENTPAGVSRMAWSAAGQIFAIKSYETICK